MHPSSHLNDWQTLYVSQPERSPFKSALGHSSAEKILNKLYSGLRDGRSGNGVVGANLRFKQGLVLVTTQDAESLPKPKGIMQRLGRFISGPEKREPHTAVSLTFIPPNRIEDCGEQFKRVDERAFLAVLTVLIPTSVLPDLNALLQSEDKARGALYAALLAPDTSNEAARAVEKIREGILYPLARNLAGLAQDTPGDKIPPNALMAAMGMFRIKPWNTKKGAEQLGDFIEGEVRLR